MKETVMAKRELKLVATSGLLEVLLDKSKGLYRLDYTGNIGATERDVAFEFDALYGKGLFGKVRAVGRYYKDEDGTLWSKPSYYYRLLITVKNFKAITRGLEQPNGGKNVDTSRSRNARTYKKRG